MNIAVIGLGKLGSPLLAVAANAGHQVVGIDLNPLFVEAIRDGKAPVAEPGLAELLSDRFEFISATMNTAEAMASAELICVVVPTPSLSSGRFASRHVVFAMKEIGLSFAQSYQVVALVSTVMPGQCEAEIIPALEAAAGKQCGRDFGFCYNPTFIALGSVIHDLTEPDLVLIGENDQRAGEVVEAFQHSIHKTSRPCCRMSIINAEIAKLALNTYVTTKISYANMLGQLCDAIAGADARVVCEAIGRDRRVGRAFFRPGTAYGGPCFVRDNKALLATAATVGIRLPLASATDQINVLQTKLLIERVMAVRKPGQVVAILGLAYKPGTPVRECSAGMDLVHALLARGVPVIVWDELALPEVEIELGDAVIYGESLATTCRIADIIVVTIPDPAFIPLPPPETAGKVIIDPWGVAR